MNTKVLLEKNFTKTILGQELFEGGWTLRHAEAPIHFEW